MFGEIRCDLQYAWRLCRKARKHGKNRPAGSYELKCDSDTGYLYRDGSTVYVVIDGSDSFSEWIKNFMWFRWGRDKVAAGFLEAAVQFAEQVDALLYDDDTVIGIGHSRGGAIIQKTALEIQRKRYCVESVVTFGAPKLGGLKFCREMREHGINHVRVVAAADPVPTLPKLRGRHYETTRVLCGTGGDVFDFGRVSRVIKGIIQHLSYGYLLKKEIKWN